jgi:competence CoiA-like predicted nuclease
MNRKKCNISFESKYAVIEGVEGFVNIEDYIDGKYTSQTPLCVPHGHELTVVRCTRKRPHFRHKHSGDVSGEPMTDWHREWQSNFPVTEQDFKNKVGQRRDRRADIVIPEFKRIIEIQHSKIERGEVMERMDDYSLHGHKVIWVIDAQNSIGVKPIDKRLILDFTKSTWLYEKFLDCEDVHYDISGFIYKLSPKDSAKFLFTKHYEELSNEKKSYSVIDCKVSKTIGANYYPYQ